MKSTIALVLSAAALEPAVSRECVESRMREVIELWDSAPWNFRKSASFRLYNAAGRAFSAGNYVTAMQRLKAAKEALHGDLSVSTFPTVNE